MRPDQKLFVVTRRDLSIPQQAVQAIHAAREFVAMYPHLEQDWYENSNHIAFLAVDTEAELRELLRRAYAGDVRTAPFYEPDLNDALTAVAVEPTPRGRRQCRGIPPALNSQGGSL